MANLTVAILGANQPNVSEFTSLVTLNGSGLRIVSFNYVVFPGLNIGTEDVGVPNTLYNRTVNVGSSSAAFISGYDYSLFIDTTTMQVLPNSDYYVSVNALLSDGSQTAYSTASLLPIAPGKITLNPSPSSPNTYSATLTRSAGTYNTEVTINVEFTEIEPPSGSTMSYNLAIQYEDGNGDIEFLLVTDLAYDALVGGVTHTFSDPQGIDEAHVALQSVRTLTSTLVKSTSELSNTVVAKDTDIPDPPRNLAVDYQYYEEPQQAVLTWLAPYSADLTDVTQFIVYRKVGVSGTFTALNPPVPYTSLGATYTFTDEEVGPEFIPTGTEVFYYVRSENSVALSSPSNIVNFLTVLPSTEPLYLVARGQANTNDPATQDIYGTFANPEEVNGQTTYGYETAYFNVRIKSLNAGYGFNTIIGSTTVAYNPSATLYPVLLENLPFYRSLGPLGLDGSGLYEIIANLVTCDGVGNELQGQDATTPFRSGPVPFIYDANGDDNEWTVETPLTSMKVLTATELVLGSVILTRRLPIPGLTIVTNYLDLPEPTTDGNGNTVYSFVWEEGDYPGTVIAVSASNSAGIGSKNVAGVV